MKSYHRFKSIHCWLTLLCCVCFALVGFQNSKPCVKGNLPISVENNTLTHETHCLSINSDGSIAVKTWDSSVGIKYEAKEACANALRALLYQGFAASSECAAVLPLLGREDSRERFASIEQKFFEENGDYLRFTQVISTTEVSKSTRKSDAVYTLTIFKPDLTKYLTEREILPKLTKGF